MATAEFSKFASILSSALSQHHFFRSLNSSAGIPPPPLALFVVMLFNAFTLLQIVVVVQSLIHV